ncbi:MAG TPA: VWA domain-containing protein [Pyrinomonadaceae bacterium]|nr:VWA domain-containing protein [Pyrinomonadaceae bacterium]
MRTFLNHPRVLRLAISIGISALLLSAPLTIHPQSGRQKDPKTANANKPDPRNIHTPIADPSNMNSDEPDEVVRVSSNLVPVPATIVDSRGVAVTNLTVEDFELRIDGQISSIGDIARSETPVQLVMLFDNSGSLDAARDFEKHAAVRFFQNVLRPVDQASIFSVSTDVTLAQPMTNNVRLLQQTIDNFGRPEGATSLYDGIFAGLLYLRPFSGRRVIVIVSDGQDTTSRTDHDFDATLQRLMGEDCQMFVVQTGLYENANVRALAAERRMEQFAAQTGGAVYIPKTVEDLDNAFAQIAADLAQQYVLSYYPTEDKRDGRYHQISLRVKTKNNVRIRARKGFLVKKRAVV